MRERAMSLSQIAGDAEASQVIKGESQDIKAELDPSYVNVKVKQQVRYFLNLLDENHFQCNCSQDGSVTHFRIKKTTAMKKVNSHSAAQHHN